MLGVMIQRLDEVDKGMEDGEGAGIGIGVGVGVTVDVEVDLEVGLDVHTEDDLDVVFLLLVELFFVDVVFGFFVVAVDVDFASRRFKSQLTLYLGGERLV
jgi:hypothetical protein